MISRLFAERGSGFCKQFAQPGRPGCDPRPPRPLLQLARVLPPHQGWGLPPQRGRALLWSSSSQNKARPGSGSDDVVRFVRHLQEANWLM